MVNDPGHNAQVHLSGDVLNGRLLLRQGSLANSAGFGYQRVSGSNVLAGDPPVIVDGAFSAWKAYSTSSATARPKVSSWRR